MTELIEESGVRGVLHFAGESKPGLVLAHGASSNRDARLLKVLADSFVAAGISVLRIDLPFRQARPTGPPHPSWAMRDQDGLHAAAGVLRKRGAVRVAIGGHSYGGRQASMLAARDPGAAEGLLFTSYPLHPPGKPEQMRTAHWPEVRTRALFVQGDRDPFGSPVEMQEALRAFGARHELLLIPGGGHELKPLLLHPETAVSAWLRFATEAAAQPSNG